MQGAEIRSKLTLLQMKENMFSIMFCSQPFSSCFNVGANESGSKSMNQNYKINSYIKPQFLYTKQKCGDYVFLYSIGGPSYIMFISIM